MPNSNFISISRRFSIALIGVVTLIMLVFAAAAMWWDASRSERQLQARLASTLEIAETSLAEPLWNFDRETVAKVLEALLLEESIVHAEIVEPQTGSGGMSVSRSSSVTDGMELAQLSADDRFTVTSSVMRRQNDEIGTIHIAISNVASVGNWC